MEKQLVLMEYSPNTLSLCEGPFDGGSVDVAAVCMYHVPR